jgi:hypothetical protein
MGMSDNDDNNQPLIFQGHYCPTEIEDSYLLPVVVCATWKAEETEAT